MFAAILAAVSGIGNILIDKALLTGQKMKISNYLPLLFLFLFLIVLVTLPWTGAVNMLLATSQQYIFYFILMIMLAIIWNVFYYQGLQKHKLIEFEMIMLLTPLVTVLMATLFFPEEYSRPVFLAAIIGSLILFLSHLRKHHFQFDKYGINLLLAVVLISMETMVQNELLRIYSPALLYALRTAFLAGFFVLYFRPKMHEVSNQQFNIVFLTAILGVITMVSRFYGFQMIGVTFTTLVLLLVPVVTSWVDAKLNKSPIRHRTLVAFTAIIICVIYALIGE